MLSASKMFKADLSFDPIVAEIEFKKSSPDALIEKEENQAKLELLLADCLSVPAEARLPNEEPIQLAIDRAFICKFEWVTENKIKISLDLDIEEARKLAYQYNRALADEAKKDKKSIKKKLSKSVYAVAKILDRLPEHPTGNYKIDEGRLVVLDSTVQHLKKGLAQQVTFKLNRSLDGWAEKNNAVLV